MLQTCIFSYLPNVIDRTTEGLASFSSKNYTHKHQIAKNWEGSGEFKKAQPCGFYELSFGVF